MNLMTIEVMNLVSDSPLQEGETSMFSLSSSCFPRCAHGRRLGQIPGDGLTQALEARDKAAEPRVGQLPRHEGGKGTRCLPDLDHFPLRVSFKPASTTVFQKKEESSPSLNNAHTPP